MSVIIPAGYSHKYGLHVVHALHGDAGNLAGMPGGRKGTTHITVTDERHVHTAAEILINEGFEPNVLVGYDVHVMRPFLYQFAPLDHASKALEHPAGTPETNRGGRINCQMEIACEVGDVPHFNEIGFYKVLGNAWGLINDHLGRERIPWKLWSPQVHQSNGGRLSAGAFIAASGHGGHRNVPNQPSGHDDPTSAFMWGTFMWRLHHRPADGWDLSGTGFKVI